MPKGDGNNVYAVRLRHPSNVNRRVTFDVTPELIETRNANYKTVEPVHMPGYVFAYGNTSPRTFNIANVKLISRTPKEASINIRRLQVLRSWTMPYFGASKGGGGDEEFDTLRTLINGTTDLPDYNREEEEIFGVASPEILGAPPDVIYLSAYSRGSQGKAEHIKNVPVIMQQLSIPYPSDVDYIPSEEGVPMPLIMTLDMTLAETHSPLEYETFDLAQYRSGTLKGF